MPNSKKKRRPKIEVKIGAPIIKQREVPRGFHSRGVSTDLDSADSFKRGVLDLVGERESRRQAATVDAIKRERRRKRLAAMRALSADARRGL